MFNFYAAKFFDMFHNILTVVHIPGQNGDIPNHVILGDLYDINGLDIASLFANESGYFAQHPWLVMNLQSEGKTILYACSCLHKISSVIIIVENCIEMTDLIYFSSNWV